MAEGDNPRTPNLRPVPSTGRESVLSSADRLAVALHALDGKLQVQDGLDGLAVWIERVAAAVAPVSSEVIERARADTRTLIDQLLELNAEVQNLIRLKQLLY